MRKFLRFLILVLMATWGAQGWADYAQFKGTGKWWYGIGSTEKSNSSVSYDGTSSFKIANGDITVSISSGVGGNTFSQEDGYVASSTGDTMVIPVGCDLTITCNVGYVDYVLFSFNNGSLGTINHSGYWTRWSHGSRHRHHSSDGYVDLEHAGIRPYGDCYNKAWWESGDTRSNSFTFYDDRESKTFRKEYTVLWKTKTTQYDEQTTGILWFYVFYTRGSKDHPVVTFPGNFSDDSKSVSLTNNWSGSTMYYTTNGNDATTSSTPYSSAFSLTQTTKIKVLNTLSQPVHSLNSDTKDDGFDENCPDSYTCQSDVAEQTIYQVWPVSLSDSKPYTTFCHKNYMRVPTGCVARTYKLEELSNGVYMTSTQNYAAGTLVPPNYTTIVSRASGSGTISDNFTNPLDNDPNNNTGNTTVTTVSDANRATTYFMGNPSSSTISTATSGSVLVNGSTTTINNSTYNYYYLSRDPGNSSRYGFYWAKNSGGKFDGCDGHKAFVAYPKSKLKAKPFYFDMGDGTVTAIENILAPETQQPDANAPMYNAAGQRVGESYKGIVIQNGRKFVKR